MFEDSKTQAVAWGNTTTLPEITVDPEKVAAAAETLRKAWAGIMTSFEVAAEAFGKRIRSVAAGVEARHETSLYNLVATYKPLPGMRRVDFQKANGRPDYWLEWTTDDGHTKAFLSSSLGHPILTITTQDAAGGQLYHEAHRLSVEGLRERGMVEEVTTAMERRRQAHGRA